MLNEKLNRLPNEKDIDYIKRIVYGKLIDKTIDEDYSELAPLIFNKEYSSDVARRMCYGVRYLLELIDKESVNNFEDNSILDELQLKKIQLEEERKRIQSVKIEYNKMVREKARIDLYLEQINDTILNLKPLEIPKHIDIIDNEKIGLLNVSDTHVGKECVVKGLKGEIINQYNYDVFTKRMWKLFNETINIIKKENLNKIYLLSLGDCIDGILRQSQIQSLELGVVDSTIRFCDFMSNYINELSKYVNIEYYSAYGNHDGLRILNAKSAKDFPHENVSKFIDFYLSKRLENNPNVIINDNQLPYSFFNVFGLNIMISHGEDKNLGQTVKDYKVMYNEDIDLIICGHMHNNYNESVGIGRYGNIEVIRVPSICGIDTFSQEIHKFSCAGSKILIIEKDKGKTITYDIVLK